MKSQQRITPQIKEEKRKRIERVGKGKREYLSVRRALSVFKTTASTGFLCGTSMTLWNSYELEQTIIER